MPKMKSHKAAQKRLGVTGSGKVYRVRAWRGHHLEIKSSRRTRRYAGPGATDDENNAKLLRELAGVPAGQRGARYVCVLAIALPDRGFVLLENRQRRAAFLELAVEELGLGNVRVDAGPAEAARLQADLCLARALARPVAAWSLAARLLGSDGSLLYWAGRTWGEQDVADLAASGVVAEIRVRGTFQWQGPLVMMRARRMSAADEPGA